MTPERIREIAEQVLRERAYAPGLHSQKLEAIEQAILLALHEQGEELASLAMNMPLQSTEERHAYRWSDTGKSMAWDISHAISATVMAMARKRLEGIE